MDGLWVPKEEGGGVEAKSEGMTQKAQSPSLPLLAGMPLYTPSLHTHPHSEWSFPGYTWTPEQEQPGCLAPLETKLHARGSPSGNLNGYGKGIYLPCSLGMLFSQVKGKAQLNKTLQGWNKIISISEYSSLSKHNLVHKLCVRMGKPLIFGLYIPCRAVRDPRGDLDHPDHRWVSPVLKLKFMCQLETSITQEIRQPFDASRVSDFYGYLWMIASTALGRPEFFP